jgi:hypothetical protein
LAGHEQKRKASVQVVGREKECERESRNGSEAHPGMLISNFFIFLIYIMIKLVYFVRKNLRRRKKYFAHFNFEF